ncbi:enoyl-CoA hydratase-related protein [Robertmurraya korlensis]|uniref:enoyl-CoA hydratase-related protein n=1 Tax=Robertmurraya korlensis TaxID=519977 RepID=UPI000825BAF6|nr:enoyl-CoA hydratase-related protein [Robertmurraya korlensis]
MSLVLFEKKDFIGFVTLNRPNALNAFNYDSLLELQQIVEQIRHDPKVRVVIFSGAGDKAFSVGADLKERKHLSPEDVMRNVDKIGTVFSEVSELPQPTIAAINGYAFGGGMELALACDFRLAVKGTKMGLTETSLGIIPGAGGTQRLPRLIGETKALELILTARKITAEQAEHLGIVNKVAETKELMNESLKLANEMLENAPIALQQAKFSIRQGMNVDLNTALRVERKAYEVTLPTADRTEALQAFSEKRKPNFQGK